MKHVLLFALVSTTIACQRPVGGGATGASASSSEAIVDQSETERKACKPKASFDVRVGAKSVAADGYSRVPVFAIGRNADGSPYTGELVFGLTRAAGHFEQLRQKVGTMGVRNDLTVCSVENTPSCLGKLRVTVALASNPEEVVARSEEVELVTPPGVGDPALCLTGGNVIYFNGESGDYIHSGPDTITDAVFSANGSDKSVAVHADPKDRAQGLWWDLEFSTEKLDQAMQTTVYTQAERAPFASPGHPGIDIGGDGRGCNTITGSFQVHQLDRVDGALQAFTATFEQHCEGGAAALRGCVHFER